MVTRIIPWPWPKGSSKKFAVRLVVRGIEGILVNKKPKTETRLSAEVRWKGKMKALSSLRSLKRNCTREEVVIGDSGKVEWNEEFENVVRLVSCRENGFNPWEIEIAVFCVLKQDTKKKTSIIGTTSLNLSDYASSCGEERELKFPLLLRGSAESRPIIDLSLKLFELKKCRQQEILQKPTSSPLSHGDKDKVSTLKTGFRRVFGEFKTCPEQQMALQKPSSPSSCEDKGERSALKAGFRRIFRNLMPRKKSRTSLCDNECSDGRCSGTSEDSHTTTCFTDSLEDAEPDVELKYHKDDIITQKSLGYDTLAAANIFGVVIHTDLKMDENHEDLIYYSHRRTDVTGSDVEEAAPSIPEKSLKRSILLWRKRKYGLRSPKEKGEPLLKKVYREEGGDDIDYDRRLLSSSDESLSTKKSESNWSPLHSSMSDFGDDNFAVGSWESKEIISRCGQMKLSTQVFFASIDQRSDKAAGQSACTALVAVIADWFQWNQGIMPNKSQLDGLIHEGSFEWRNLCKNQAYIEWFPDKHFDIETVLQAKIRPLSVAPEKSFIGFFHPEGSEDNSCFEFLHGAMSFDSIWEEISQTQSDCLFIVSWNDHFFVLKVEQDAYYIIETLGERLYEGCDQAYILKFDNNTTIHRLPCKMESSENSDMKEGSGGEESECRTPKKEELVCMGKESCKEYIKSFLAAIPIRELQTDMMNGRMTSTLFHQRLQIEFHYTEPSAD